MLIVSNTSPLLNLAIVNRLDLLQQQFSEVVIPAEVYDELGLERNLPGAFQLRDVLEKNWLRVVRLQNDQIMRALATDLDDGEAAAIALALQLNVPKILMDESEGRARARALGLEPVGVLGVLLVAKRNGQIDSLKRIMAELRQVAGFFISDKLYSQLLTAAQEE